MYLENILMPFWLIMAEPDQTQDSWSPAHCVFPYATSFILAIIEMTFALSAFRSVTKLFEFCTCYVYKTF